MQKRFGRNSKRNEDRGSSSAFTLELANKAYKVLNQAKTLIQPIDPHRQIENAPVPYKICGRSNPVKDASYPGLKNDSGNLLDILPTSLKSVTLDCYDIGHMELKLKYMYLAINGDDKNLAANIQYGKAITEALSKVASDTFTDLPFFKDFYDSPDVDEDEGYTQAFTVKGMPNTDTNHGFGEILTWYQSMVINMMLPITSYAKLLSLEDHLKMMGYNREASILSELFGLLRKKSFQAFMNTLNGYIKSAYLDIPWFRQINVLANGVCRQVDDCRHPLLTLTAVMEVPNIRVSTVDPESADFNPQTDVIFEGTNYRVNGKRFEDAVNDICSLMSPYNVIKWARQFMNGTLPAGAPQTVNSYFNEIKNRVEAMLGVLAKFPKDTADIKTMLDVAQRGNLNRWNIGQFVQFDTREQVSPVFNKLIFDVYRSYMSTTSGLSWDTKTLRWSFKTPWDDVLGIPEYDCFNGGSFLTFSNFSLPVSATETGKEQKFLVPILYRIDPTGLDKAEIVFTNRQGREVVLKRITRTLGQDALLARLNLIKDTAFNNIVMPVIHTHPSDVHTPYEESSMLYLIEQIFGFGGRTVGVPDEPTQAMLTHEVLNSDIIGFVDVEMQDVSNDMIVYYQTYAPLKVYTADGSRTVGFTDSQPITFNK